MTVDEEAEIDAAISDPTIIKTHDQALTVMDYLDHDIAGIEAQLEVARCEAAYAPLPEARQAWLRRAAYALARKRGQRGRVWQRDREIRGTKGPAQTPPKVTVEEKVSKQDRLKAEATARQAAKLAQAEVAKVEAMRLANARDWRRRFVSIVKDRYGQDVVNEISSQAREELEE